MAPVWVPTDAVPLDTGTQIGLNPLITWGCGIALWLPLALQALCFPKPRGQDSPQTSVRDRTLACLRGKRGPDIFIYELTVAWFDFVSDLAIALGAHFPYVTLFVLTWVFIGVQVIPYLGLVFFVHPPKGWMYLPPPAALLNVKNLYAAPRLAAASALTSWAADAWSRHLGHVLRACGERDATTQGRLVLKRAAAAAWLAVGGSLGSCLALLAAFVFWVIVLLAVTLQSVAWLSAWATLVCMWLIMRLVLLAFGFLLYAGMLLPFPDAPVTGLFYWLWCQKDLRDTVAEPVEKEALRLEETLRNWKAIRPDIRSMSMQGVKIFTLHFTYVSDLLFESISQFTIQILVASLGTCTTALVVSIVISGLVICFFAQRYAYWLVFRPVLFGTSWAEELVRLHLHCYHTPEGPIERGALDQYGSTVEA
mmetsp:Transcript_13718/g.37050  ORF Transcript_13718/g.37050 Transcript_13718/m.37050 type:complete len:423 (+) Transcript_13718:66-1334(+)